MESLPRSLERRRKAAAEGLGRPVYVRGVRTPDRGLRGRMWVESGRVVIEYQVAEAGYFWHVAVIEELLDRAAAGEQKAELRAAFCGRREERQER